jgi:hypothetical protein
MTSTAVVDVRYKREGSTERLDVVLGPDDVLTIAVKPAIRLDHAAKRADRE